MIQTEYTVTCMKDCGLLGEHLSARDSDLLCAKHVKNEGHAVIQSGAPVPPRR